LSGDAKIVKVLLAKGAEVNACNRHGDTSLIDAASGGRVEVARLLLRAGANPGPAGERGYTALHLAASMPSKSDEPWMLQKDHTTRSKLRKRYCEVVSMLIARGAVVNAKTADGATPLALARSAGHDDIVRLLRRHRGT